MTSTAGMWQTIGKDCSQGPSCLCHSSRLAQRSGRSPIRWFRRRVAKPWHKICSAFLGTHHTTIGPRRTVSICLSPAYLLDNVFGSSRVKRALQDRAGTALECRGGSMQEPQSKHEEAEKEKKGGFSCVIPSTSAAGMDSRVHSSVTLGDIPC